MIDKGMVSERKYLLKGSGNAWFEKQEEKTNVLHGGCYKETHSI
jgi:hypothetical protein